MTLLIILIISVLWIGWELNRAPLMDDDGNFVNKEDEERWK
jgi:hypothetical protein